MIDHAVILAIGSMAHRSQLTQTLPRAMLPAVGKPLVTRVLERLQRANIENYTVVVGVNEGAVAAYLNRSHPAKMKLNFVLKSANESLLSILSNITKQIGKPYLLSAYNSFTHPEFIRSLLQHQVEYPQELIITGARATLSASSHPFYALMDGQRITNITRDASAQNLRYAITDIAICGEHFIHYLANITDNSPNTFTQQFMDIIQHYLMANGQATLGETAWTLQIESDYDLLTLSRQILDEGLDGHLLSELPYTVRIVPPVRVDPRVSVGQGATIGPYVYLQHGSTVGREATVRHSLVLEGATVAPGSIVDNAIITPRTIIKS